MNAGSRGLGAGASSEGGAAPGCESGLVVPVLVVEVDGLEGERVGCSSGETGRDGIAGLAG